jgi:hypothetical protein
MNHNVAFSIDEPVLATAVDSVKGNYRDAEYVLGLRDCAGFSAGAAREVGLRVPLLNFTPYGSIEILADWNDDRSAVR